MPGTAADSGKMAGMKKRIFFFLAVFLFFSLELELFAFGRKQADVVTARINTDWTFMITAFDTSAMSPAWQTAGDTIARNFVATLQNVNSRLRVEDESIFYRDIAWKRARTAAVSALASKRNERDQLIFSGDPSWRYRRSLRAVDEQIHKLTEDLARIETALPIVEQRPTVILHQRNTGGIFPPPPAPGGEIRFCTDNNVDAFLVGRLSEFHGRIFLDMKLYTQHTASFSHEDHVLFSPEDFDMVLEEITERMVMLVSGVNPSKLTVHATPPEAMVLIDGAFVGRGEVEHRRLPGEAEISVQANNFLPVSFPLALEAGEFAEIFINLTTLGLNAFQVDTSNRPGSSVFRGGLFVGETPLTMEFTGHEIAYITVETADGETGSVIYRDNNLIGGSTHFVREGVNFGRADFITAPPVPEEEKRVSRVRNAFYTAYGAAWIALPVSLLTAGIAANYIAANNFVIANNLYSNDRDTRSRISSSASTANNLTNVSYGLIGAALGVTFFQVYRYIRASGREATPLTKVIKAEEEEIELEEEFENEELEEEPEELEEKPEEEAEE